MSSHIGGSIFGFDPLNDNRWPELVDRHPESSVFHARPWLRALAMTYGYRSVAFTTSPPGEALANGMVCCEVKSWLTGRRLVSLPFSDHCEPLVRSGEDLQLFLSDLQNHQPGRWNYVELRPRSNWSRDANHARFAESASYFLHCLDLHPALEDLYRGFHEDSVRRKIRRADREGLQYQEGRSEALLADFYRLLLMTRRRHQLPPQPIAWFRNLISSFGDRLKLRLAMKDGQPLAGILTLRHKQSLVYKYGCSDARFHNLGGMVLLFWKAIQDAKQNGLDEMDFGRSDCDQSGLVTFKDHWGTVRSPLIYFRYPAAESRPAVASRQITLARRIASRAPDSVLVLAGKLFYKHIG